MSVIESTGQPVNFETAEKDGLKDPLRAPG